MVFALRIVSIYKAIEVASRSVLLEKALAGHLADV
jgi:hypothetical protein